AALVPYENVDSFRETILFGNFNRTTLYLVPKAPPVTPAPAIVLLHYLDGTVEPMANLVAAGVLAREFGTYVIMPQAYNGAWNQNPTAVNQVNDVGFIDHVIDDAVERFNLDPKRIYIAGYSNGGFMAVRYACAHPAKVAAVTAIAATIRASVSTSCSIPMTMPVMMMHGTQDEQIPYDGSSTTVTNPLLGNNNLSAPDAAQYWADVNGCAGAPVVSQLQDRVPDGTTMSLARYGNCAPGGAMDFYTVTGGGHNWPGAIDALPQLGLTSQDLNATITMWNFFKQFARP
ncbi:MAG TPA: alpha/beta fold hydrolase, partial [Nevskiaceae bacterium]|nr:alpha/beta fold hydrolase [Nevskiaceae bacterium]